MIEQGALNAMMSGSGPTVFGIYEDREKAEKTKRIIQDMNLAEQVYVVDADGKIVYSHTGYAPGSELELLKAIKKLQK
jgi:4-diphosphocytidyl-2C-methyl-D-erythritol kinase